MNDRGPWVMLLIFDMGTYDLYCYESNTHVWSVRVVKEEGEGEGELSC